MRFGTTSATAALKWVQVLNHVRIRGLSNSRFHVDGTVQEVSRDTYCPQEARAEGTPGLARDTATKTPLRGYWRDEGIWATSNIRVASKKVVTTA